MHLGVHHISCPLLYPFCRPKWPSWAGSEFAKNKMAGVSWSFSCEREVFWHQIRSFGLGRHGHFFGLPGMPETPNMLWNSELIRGGQNWSGLVYQDWFYFLGKAKKQERCMRKWFVLILIYETGAGEEGRASYFVRKFNRWSSLVICINEGRHWCIEERESTRT